MEQRPTDESQTAATPAVKYGGATTERPTVDRFPKTAQDWGAFAALPAEARGAAYLKSIRTMMLFFTVLTILGIIAAVILALVGIHAIDDTQQVTTNPFG